MHEIVNQDMEEILRAEVETLRKVLSEKNYLLKQCAHLLFDYGHTFNKEDKEKAIDLITEIKGSEYREEILKCLEKQNDQNLCAK